LNFTTHRVETFRICSFSLAVGGWTVVVSQ
jgi:hypothetical protein